MYQPDSGTECDDGALPDSRVVRSCPICACRVVTVLHHQEFATPHELKAPSAYDVVSCRRCGFVYANQAVDQSALDRDYEAHSKYAPEDRVAADPPWDLERLAGVAAYLSERSPNKALRVLDAGCANGSFLGYMREQGFENVVGIDPSPAAVANAKARYGVEAVAGSFVHPPTTLSGFDLVALSHTLEHLADVGGAVRSLRALLRPDGMAYVEVPDASRFADYLVAPFHDFNTEHINHFSLRTLQALMEAYDFEEVDAGRRTVHNSPSDEYPVAYGLWRRAAHRAGRRIGELPVTAQRDDELVDGIRRYIAASRALLRQMDERLRVDLAEHEEVIVWGAGQLTMKLLRDTVLSEKRVAAVIDSATQRQGMHIDHTRILAPRALQDLPSFPIVIGSLHSESSIAAAITRELCLPNPVVRLFRRPNLPDTL